MSEIKVNKISPRSGTEVTLGDSGDTFTIPSGATINNQGTATNFGATGSASWNTTVKTGDFTAVAGEGYFVNTTSGEVDVALPAGTPGAVVAIKDYAKTFDTNNCILVQNGSDKIGGSTENAILSTEGIAVTLIFIDSTQGWLVTDDGNQSVANTNPYLVATGGTITTSGNCKIHTFTGPGTFEVTQTATSTPDNVVDYLVVAGGGGGTISCNVGGGGGAGGFRFFAPTPSIPGAPGAPLNGPAGLPVSIQSYSITVGAGGASSPTGSPSRSGTVSTFSSITSAGGGGGGGNASPAPNIVGESGGSGGGGGSSGPTGAYYAGGTGNTPPVSPSQGNPGGQGRHRAGTAEGAGGGGGAISAGLNGDVPSPPAAGGIGGTGAGLPAAVFGSNGVPCGAYRYYAGGGGGGGNGQGVAGLGGGGNGSNGGQANPGVAGTANTGGGGGGGFKGCGTGAAGGSGIVVIRYKFQ